MPINDLLYVFKDSLYKFAIIFGGLLIIYGILWLLVELGIIPLILINVFPQIVIILLGIIIIYVAYTKRI